MAVNKEDTNVPNYEGQRDSVIERRPSEVMTMFSPYNSFKNTDPGPSSREPAQNEATSTQQRADPDQTGGARVFFKKLFSIGSSGQTTPTGDTPTLPRKPTPVVQTVPSGKLSNATDSNQATVLVRPKVSGNKQSTDQPLNMNTAGSNQATPTSPTHSVARWNANSEAVVLDSQTPNQQLSLTSYSQPRQQVNRTDVMSRFGQFEADQVR